MRPCNRCGAVLPASEFVTFSGARAPSCKGCRLNRIRTHWTNDPPPEERDEFIRERNEYLKARANDHSR